MNTRYFALIGLVLFAYIIISVGPASIIATLFSMNVFYLAAAVALSLISVFFRSVKWKMTIEANGMRYGYKSSFTSWLAGFFSGLLTPGRLGDLTRSLYLRSDKNTLGRSISTVVVDRFFDILILFAFGAVASVLFAFIFGRQIFDVFIIAALGVFFVAAFYLMTRKGAVKAVFRPIMNVVLPDAYKTKAKMTFNDFYDSLAVMKKRKGKLALANAIGVMGWVFDVAFTYVLALSLSINAPFYFMFIVLPIINILEILPVSISGIGTRDAALIFLFSFIGIGTEAAVAFSIVFLVFGLWFFGLIGGLIFLRNPVDISIYKQEEVA